jgi:Mce-associated membrane protein
VTAVLDASATTPSAPPAPAVVPLASWPSRAGALAIDVLPGAAVVTVLALLALAAPPRGWLWWLFTALAALVVAAMVLNRWLLPTMTGWSLGRSLFGIRVLRSTGAAPGVVRLLLRDLAHLLDTGAVLLGWLWPLWDRRNRTFADLLARTEVHTVDRPARDMHRPVAAMLVAAVLLSAAATGLGYLTVFRPQQQLDAARSQIAEQGPRIVEQLLSYGVDTAKDDFAKAQSLAADSYRPQLVAQQEAVQKAGLVGNEYWAVSSAVLSSSRDQASMLLAMQGQRGTKPEDMKFITATVRVEFEKVDGQWRVANLTVLKKPQMMQEGQ